MKNELQWLSLVALFGAAACVGEPSSLPSADRPDAAPGAGGVAPQPGDAWPEAPLPDAGAQPEGAAGGGAGGETGSGGIPKPGSLTNLTPSGPLVIDGQSNVTLSGLRIENPSGPCIQIKSSKNIRITGSEIGPCGDGKQPYQACVSVLQSSQVQVDHNVLHDCATGVQVVGAPNAEFDDIVVRNNYIQNVRGPFPQGELVQFDTLIGRGNKILCNIGDNQVNLSPMDGTEDNINTWQSHGKPDSYIEIAYNRMIGHGGHSRTGSGINAGDGAASFIDVHHNTVVNVNNGGIIVTGGHDILVRENRVFNDWDGGGTVGSGAGLFVRTFYGDCYAVSVTGNRSWGIDYIWWNDGQGQQPAHWIDFGECGPLGLANNIWGDTSLSAAIFDEPYAECE
jgi:hypothetical protein